MFSIFRSIQLAQTQAKFQSLGGLVGVNVHLHGAQVAGDAHAVADAVQAAAQGIDILLHDVREQVFNPELGAVDVLQLAGQAVLVLVAVAFHALGFIVAGQLLAPQHGGIAHVDVQEAPSAGVHHARLSQRGQHLLGLFQNDLAGGKDVGKQRIVVVGRALGLLDGFLGNDAGHGQDGALLGLHHGLIGGLRAAFQRGGKLCGSDALHSGQRPAEAAQKLGGDNAAVAPGALQRALRYSRGGLARVQVFLLVDLPGGGGHGQAHIGAGISVRHGENVQRVHRFPVFFQKRGARDHHIPQQHPVDRFGLDQGHFLPIRL